LLACSPRRPAKVDEINNKPHRTQTKSNQRHPQRLLQNKTHRVVKGDSLYSIGFRYQVDYKKLAAINNIKPPYRIYPNQIIKLKGSTQVHNKKQITSPKSNTSVKVKPLVTQPTITAQPDTNKPNNKTTAQSNTSTQAKQQTSNTAVKKTVKKPAQTTNKPIVIKTPTNKDLNWLWPTKGKIRTTFLASNPARKGISIGGTEGQPVKATEAGVVVYSGNGLLGYGELIIIKHNEHYLSAYGHNKSLKVKEGETVKRGQIIAELGSTGTNVNNLHFEIRKNGQPVNPLNYVKP